uniref:DUF47 domain-containing protein n=1 Tax=uncultured Dechloromonas sp. TaxID=171719 RepID=UPI0025FF1FAD
MSDEKRQSIVGRLFERVFPKMPDFFGLLAEQCQNVAQTAGRLVEFMESGDPAVGQCIRQDEHDADRIKIRNLHTLNEAFSTPIDREDIYRAIVDLDEIVNYCKSTVSEMEVLGLAPDKHCLEMAMHIKLGTDALVQGYSRLAKNPQAAAADADTARKAERRVEKNYRRAISELFVGDDYIHMFKRR